MKVEERQVKSMFLTGVIEIITGLILYKFNIQFATNYGFLGYLGYGMIVYSIILGYYIRRKK
ncbi:MAG: hypothetical protein ACOYWZ_17385 [Bacillota bacterium]